jgi:hypothetical protein
VFGVYYLDSRVPAPLLALGEYDYKKHGKKKYYR